MSGDGKYGTTLDSFILVMAAAIGCETMHFPSVGGRIT